VFCIIQHGKGQKTIEKGQIKTNVKGRTAEGKMRIDNGQRRIAKGKKKKRPSENRARPKENCTWIGNLLASVSSSFRASCPLPVWLLFSFRMCLSKAVLTSRVV